jgi:hypothetical protein
MTQLSYQLCRVCFLGWSRTRVYRDSRDGKTEIVVINGGHRQFREIVSGSNLEMGTEHVMDVQITCYGCP